MTSTKRKQISTLAESIREELNLTSPVDFDKAIELLNGELEYIIEPIEGKIEANEFAGAFLMPRSEFLNILNESKESNLVDVGKIAAHFNVSKEAVKIRGRWLGVF